MKISSGHARLLRDRTHRQFHMLLERASRKFGDVPAPRKRAAAYRHMQRLVDYAFKDSPFLIERVERMTGSKKDVRTLWFLWEPVGAGFGVTIVRACVANGVEIESRDAPIVLTAHAIERTFQRLRTTDPNDSLPEFSGAVKILLGYYSRWHSESKGKMFQLKTAHGLACVKVSETREYVITTWVDDFHLTVEQKRQLRYSDVIKQVAPV